MATIAVLGSGGWGTAMAVVLAGNPDHDVRLWSARESTSLELRSQRENKRQLTGIPIPESIRITPDIAEATANAECWIIAIPTAFLHDTLIRLAPFATPGITVVSLVKGLEIGTFRRPTEIIRATLHADRLVVLSGPSHAEEVARGLPTSLVAAGAEATLTGWVQRQLGNERLRIYTNSDMAGVELAGALKNVIGIAAGVCDGLRFGDNAKAALITRGLVEMTRFGVAHGAQPATFGGLAGVGDLITTCFSPHGRNRRLGERITQGGTLQDWTAGAQVVEGVYTARSVQERIRQFGLDMPIMTGVYNVLYESQPPLDVVSGFFARQLRGEDSFLG